MKQIKLTQGKLALVDDESFDYLNQFHWSYRSRYASRAKQLNGKRIGTIYMHRVVNNTPDGFDTDHINQNKLDNRKENLRTVTRSQNNFNSPPPKDNKSGTKGVFWHKQAKKWWAYININSKRQSLGMYKTSLEACNARNRAEKENGLCV